MTQTRVDEGDQEFVRRAVEAAIRICLLAGLALWCFAIVKPFVMPVLWGVIFAVALFPVFEWIARRLGGRRRHAESRTRDAGRLMPAVPPGCGGPTMDYDGRRFSDRPLPDDDADHR